MGPFMPAPPPGATPPPRWGSEDHVSEQFDGLVTGLTTARDVLPVALGDRPSDYRDYFKQRYGPTIVAYRNVADQPGRAEDLDAQLDALFERTNRATAGAPARYAFEYLTFVAYRAGR
jgi:hypothetical protein